MEEGRRGRRQKRDKEKKIDASPFWVGTPQIWYGLRVSAKGFSKGTPDFDPGPK
jgi:hypothetical protein